MTREEALKIVRENYPHFGTTEPWLDLEKALATLIPELRESEYEAIRKSIVATIEQCTDILEPKNQKRMLSWLEKQKEQKPNIELIQRSWYMEGYHDREFGKEPMWIIKTGEGGPKHELNPKYGQPLADEQNPAWSGEDDVTIKSAVLWLEKYLSTIGAKDVSSATQDGILTVKVTITNLKSLRPSWKPSEEHLSALLAIFNDPDNIGSQTCQLALSDLYEQLKKL